MIEVKGKYNTAKIFASNYDSETYNQVLQMCNLEHLKNAKIRIMADCHSGKGCTIGTTIKLNEKKIDPRMVGVDIGCAVLVAELGSIDIDLEALDRACHEAIKTGRNIYDYFEREYVKDADIEDKLHSLNAPLKDIDYVKRSIGSLGGGNHYVEVDEDSAGCKYLMIHSGSRYLGIEVCKHFTRIAEDSKKSDFFKKEREALIEKMKAEGKQKDIALMLNTFDKQHYKSEVYVEDKDFDDYIHDMQIAQEYAYLNRNAILTRLIRHYNTNAKKKINAVFSWSSVHNYIDIKNLIVRKGSIAALKNEKCVIPISMKDGALICVGKSNEEYNCSAPHGAGRLMSRSKAKETLDLEDFKKSMKGIYTTTVNRGTIDESPMAYKTIEDIVDNIQDTVEILEHVKSIFNFKADSE